MVRRLERRDQQRLDAFLRKRLPFSFPILGDLERWGSSGHQGELWGAFAQDELKAVLAHSSSSVCVCGPDETAVDELAGVLAGFADLVEIDGNFRVTGHGGNISGPGGVNIKYCDKFMPRQSRSSFFPYQSASDNADFHLFYPLFSAVFGNYAAQCINVACSQLIAELPQIFPGVPLRAYQTPAYPVAFRGCKKNAKRCPKLKRRAAFFFLFNGFFEESFAHFFRPRGDHFIKEPRVKSSGSDGIHIDIVFPAFFRKGLS